MADPDVASDGRHGQTRGRGRVEEKEINLIGFGRGFNGISKVVGEAHFEHAVARWQKDGDLVCFL